METIAAGSVEPTTTAESGPVSGAVPVIPTAATLSGPVAGAISGAGSVKTSGSAAVVGTGSTSVLKREDPLCAVPVTSILAAALVLGTGGASVDLAVGPRSLRGSPVLGAGSGAGILTSLPFPALGFVSGIGHLLNEIQCHLGIDVAGRVDGVQSPACPQGLFHLLPAAAGAADQLNAVQHHGRLQLLLEKEFQLCQVRDEC